MRSCGACEMLHVCMSTFMLRFTEIIDTCTTLYIDSKNTIRKPAIPAKPNAVLKYYIMRRLYNGGSQSFLVHKTPTLEMKFGDTP